MKHQKFKTPLPFLVFVSERKSSLFISQYHKLVHTSLTFLHVKRKNVSDVLNKPLEIRSACGLGTHCCQSPSDSKNKTNTINWLLLIRMLSLRLLTLLSWALTCVHIPSCCWKFGEPRGWWSSNRFYVKQFGSSYSPCHPSSVAVKSGAYQTLPGWIEPELSCHPVQHYWEPTVVCKGKM